MQNPIWINQKQQPTEIQTKVFEKLKPIKPNKLTYQPIYSRFQSYKKWTTKAVEISELSGSYY